MQMNRMGQDTKVVDLIRDDDTDGGVGAEVVDIPLRVIGVVVHALVGEHQDWGVVVCAEGDAVHEEEEVAG